ncbi:hypothetical protein BGW39_011472, partial [Mortierella sp. 14UC]
MEYSPGFRSRCALDVLMCCRHLQDFKALRLSVTDILATSQPWVWLGLKNLQIGFEGYEGDLMINNLLTFKQLSRLIFLEEVD